MDKNLQLVFLTANDKSFTINIDTPLEPIDPLKVNDCMNTIIANDLITTPNGSLVGIKGAYLVTKTVQEIQLG